MTTSASPVDVTGMVPDGMITVTVPPPAGTVWLAGV
jgi:hypothetical protein